MSGAWIRAPSCDAGKGDRFPVRKLHNKREAPAHPFDRPSQCREVHVGALLDGGHLLTPRDFANFSCVSSRALRISCTPNGTELMPEPKLCRSSRFSRTRFTTTRVPPSRERGAVGTKPSRGCPAVKTKRRRHYGQTARVTSSLSRYARSWESTWEPCSGGPEEVAGAFFDGCRDSSARRLRYTRIPGRFQPRRSLTGGWDWIRSTTRP